jgi:ribulose 1,5-bisphosphate carboxylase large subunit-like protein
VSVSRPTVGTTAKHDAGRYVAVTDISYGDFLDTGYRPADEDLVCTFRLRPAGDLDLAAVASRVAAESSSGTGYHPEATPTSE